eukprot:g19218.t1
MLPFLNGILKKVAETADAAGLAPPGVQQEEQTVFPNPLPGEPWNVTCPKPGCGQKMAYMGGWVCQICKFRIPNKD